MRYAVGSDLGWEEDVDGTEVEVVDCEVVDRCH